MSWGLYIIGKLVRKTSKRRNVFIYLRFILVCLASCEQVDVGVSWYILFIHYITCTMLVCIKKEWFGVWIFLELWRWGTVRFTSRMQIKCTHSINSVFWAIVSVGKKWKYFIPFNLPPDWVFECCWGSFCWAPFEIIWLKDLRQNFGPGIEFLLLILISTQLSVIPRRFTHKSGLKQWKSDLHLKKLLYNF